MKITPGYVQWWFKLTIPKPGKYRIILLLASPEFYAQDDIGHVDLLEARGPGFLEGDNLAEVAWAP